MTTRTKHHKYKAQAVLTFLREYVKANDGRSPTLKEVCEGTGISSTSVASYWIGRLEASGQVTRIAGQARSLRPVEPVTMRGRRRRGKGVLVVHAVENLQAEAADGEYRHRIRVEYVRAEQGGLNVRAFSGTGPSPAAAMQRASAEMAKWLEREVGA